MKINVWVTKRLIRGTEHWVLASLQDECDFCYDSKDFTLAEAKQDYETVHRRERMAYNYIEKF